jgi:DNA-binding NarL/FixJ family response regulator
MVGEALAALLKDSFELVGSKRLGPHGPMALAALLKDSFELVGLARDGHALIEEAARLKPDVIVMDIFMPILNGIDAARQLRSRGVDSKIVFLTMHADAKIAAEAFRAGASGFVSKESAGEELIRAIQEAVQGGAYITPLVAKDMIDILVDARTSAPGIDPVLTSRQREVLQLIAEGRTMKEIGNVLRISVRTAETHKYEAMEALGVQTTAELIQWAIRLRLVSIT